MPFSTWEAFHLSFKVVLALHSLYLEFWEVFVDKHLILAFCALILTIFWYYFRLGPPKDEDLLEIFGRDESRRSGGLHTKVPLELLPPGHGQGPPYKLDIIGHRGCGIDGIENTLAAFKLAKSRGATAIEFDVTLTKDRVPVIFHDDTTSRMTNQNLVVSNTLFEILRGLDLSVNQGQEYEFYKVKPKDVFIPTLEEAIKLCLELDLRFILDLKDSSSEMVDKIVEAYHNHPRMYSRAFISSFYPLVIYRIRRKNPRIIGCMAFRPGIHQYSSWSPELREHRHTVFFMDYFAMLWDLLHHWLMHNVHWWFLGLSAVLLQKDFISKESMTIWLGRSIRVFPWTVNNAIEKLHLSINYGVGYLTDTLDGDTYSTTNIPIQLPIYSNSDTESSVSLTPPDDEPSSDPGLATTMAGPPPIFEQSPSTSRNNNTTTTTTTRRVTIQNLGLDKKDDEARFVTPVDSFQSIN